MFQKRFTLPSGKFLLDVLLAAEAAPLLAALVFLAAHGQGPHSPEFGWPDSPLLRWVGSALSGQG